LQREDEARVTSFVLPHEERSFSRSPKRDAEGFADLGSAS
jgi:hypothetical protein